MKPRRTARPHSGAAAADGMRAPLFAALVERIGAGGRWVILDLGPAQATTVAFLTRFRCRLDIVDLPASLDAVNAGRQGDELHRQLDAILPDSRKEPADVVFCWDLLNYLERPAFTALLDHVAERARPGALIHALLAYSATRIPARPGAFLPRMAPGDGNKVLLSDASVSAEQRVAPGYTPEDLARCNYHYRVERGVLLNNGMQEFLFRL